MSRTPLFDDDADRVLAHYRAANAALTDEASAAADSAAAPADAAPDPRVRRTVLAVAARQLREVAPAQQAGAAPLHTTAGKVHWLRWPKLPVWGNALAATLMVGVLVVAVTPRVQEEAAVQQAAGDLNVPTTSPAPAAPAASTAGRTADAAPSASGAAAMTEAAPAAAAGPSADMAQRSAKIAREPAPPTVLPQAVPAPAAPAPAMAAAQERAEVTVRSAPQAAPAAQTAARSAEREAPRQLLAAESAAPAPAVVPQPAQQANVLAAAPPPAAPAASAEPAGSVRSKSGPAPDLARTDTAPAAALMAKPRAQTADAAPVAGAAPGAVTDAARRSPDSWAEAIRKLLRDGQTEPARAELRRLQAAYPAWPLPDDLRKLTQTDRGQ